MQVMAQRGLLFLLWLFVLILGKIGEASGDIEISIQLYLT